MLRRLVLCAAILVVAMVFGCSKDRNVLQPKMGAVHGRLFGVINLPASSIPDSIRPERLPWLKHRTELDHGYTTWELLPSGMYQFRTTYPTDSLTMTVGGQPAQITKDGEFTAENVPLGQQDIVLYLRGEPANKATVTIVQGGNELTREIVYNPCCVAKELPAEPNAANETFGCLTTNGPGYGFYYSDCYVSLLYGPWNYRWMCWTEAMDRLSPWKPSNIWCNGTHNCSLWVHGWNWNAQRWHYHPYPWRP